MQATAVLEAKLVDQTIDPKVTDRSVRLCAGGEDRVRLLKILEQIKCDVCEDGDASPAEAGTLLAAIVCDRDEAPLALCEQFSGICPVILVSDRVDFDFRVAAARAGVAAVMRRPLSPTELAEWLASFTLQKTGEAFSVLIVDDDWLTSEVNAEVLRSAGMTVTTVCDSRLALQAIEDSPPDLVLMDMQMPGVDGVELTRVIRQSRQFFSLPIIFLSAERDEARQFTARRLGGDDFISKPVVPEKLINLVRLRADRSKLLRTMIERDRLTGLYDQTIFKERLTQELERCRRTGSQLSVVMIDVDHFKRVNDSYGHAVGDQVLRMLADALRSGLRQTDIVGRCGGEEFGALLLDTQPEDAAMAIDRIRQDFLQTEFRSASGSFAVSFSAGVASSRDHGERLIDLMTLADEALYEAKRSGRNRICLASAPSSNTDVLHPAAQPGQGARNAAA